MKVAIMQPYLFPYIGYFQLINAVDVFVMYDDVSFIKKGWVNRNRLLSNGAAYIFTVPVVKASQNRRINQIAVLENSQWLGKLLKTIKHSYSKAPNFCEIFPLVEAVLSNTYGSIGELATASILAVHKHLNLATRIVPSSEKYKNDGLERAERLIDIAQREGCSEYINAIGGVELYSKDYFHEKGLSLAFLEPELTSYLQYGDNFVGGLSIIDALMFAGKNEVLEMLRSYRLV